MAQQTQIKTLLPYYERFLKAFPTPEVLAKADLEEVYHYWEGLGYYSRAKNLKRAAEEIVRTGFPKTYRELLKLPGVGPYTAGAVSSICFNERVPAVDGNVIRVLSRVYGIRDNLREEKNKRVLNQELIETMPDKSGEYNQSLMELGALVCESKNPNCLICPLRTDCVAYKEGLTDSLPVKNKKAKKRLVKRVAIIPTFDKEIYYVKRDETGLLSNTYGFPITDTNEEPKRALENLCKEFNITSSRYLGKVRHIFTHLIWEVDVYCGKLEKPSPKLVHKARSLPTAFKKMRELLS